MVVVKGRQSDLSPSTQGMIVFITPKVYRSHTSFISVLYAHLRHKNYSLSLAHEIMASTVRFALICKQMATVFLLSLVSSQPVNTPLSLQDDFAAKYR